MMNSFLSLVKVYFLFTCFTMEGILFRDDFIIVLKIEIKVHHEMEI